MNKFILTIDFGLHSETRVVNSTFRELYDYTSSIVRIARREHCEAKVVVRNYETGICLLYAFARQSERDGVWVAEVR